MPLPLILGIGAAVAGIAGIGSGIHGGIKMKEASHTMKIAEERHKKNLDMLNIVSEKTNTEMDKLGVLEFSILKSFDRFTRVFEQINNRPEFKKYDKDNIVLPKLDDNELKKVSIGASALLGGAGGAAIGTLGGFAAAGATTTAVMALGTASTGTAIASLSGVAATNATLAALGGGAVAAGGGGMALGTTILGAATLGVGLLVGGVIFSIAGASISDKADEAWDQMSKAEKEINKICNHMNSLTSVADKYSKSLNKVNCIYIQYLNNLGRIVERDGKRNWEQFTEYEKKVTENTILLVGLLYKMCKVELVLKSTSEACINKINSYEIEKSILDSKELICSNGLTTV